MGDLTEEERKVAEKEFREFSRAVAATGFAAIRPAKGDPFVEGSHTLVGSESSLAPHGTVAKCVAWGYRNGDRIIRPAEVILSQR